MIETKNKTITTDESLTLCKALSFVREHSDWMSESIDSSDIDSLSPYFDFLQARLGLSPVESTLFAVIYDHSEGGVASVCDLATELSLSVAQVKSYKSHFDNLLSRHLIHSGLGGAKRVRCYFVDREVLDAIDNDNDFHYQQPVVTCNSEFFSILDTYYDRRFSQKIGVEELHSLTSELLALAKDVPVVVRFNQMAQHLDPAERQLFLFMLMVKVRANNDRVHYDFFRRCFNDIDASRLCFALSSGRSLVAMGLVEADQNPDVPVKQNYHLTSKAIDGLDIHVANSSIEPFSFDDDEPQEICYQMIEAASIVSKDLSYNAQEAYEMQLLRDLLSLDGLAQVQQTLASKGMRKGVNVLFYGEPGTGKTEGVRQLARATGRDIMMVDFSAIRSKWVGDSEKNLKRLFSDYRSLVSTKPVTPILLLNEADAVLGRRLASPERSSDRMENTLQNILLQEMEDIDGLLIATTNLATALDSAFERRFLIKLQFHKPEPAVRQRIWMSMIPELSEQEAATLASNYDLSGGNMENIVRKCTMEECLYRQPVTFARLQALCAEETVASTTPRRIGF